MRQYEPIWAAIKRNKLASIVAPIHNHRRIIKAVTKEKYNDDGYKLELAESGLKSKLVVTQDIDNKEMLTFTLQITMNTSCIGVNNL